jgi:hypothetical protein
MSGFRGVGPNRPLYAFNDPRAMAGQIVSFTQQVSDVIDSPDTTEIGKYLIDHPYKSGGMIFGGVFTVGVTAGVGIGVATGTLTWGVGTTTVVGTGAAAAPALPKAAEIVEEEAPVVENAFARIGSTGQIGEQALEELGGTGRAPMKTDLGWRIVDRLVDAVAHESKVGYTSLTKFVSTQIAKDSWLLTNDKVNQVVWHFFQSPVTGRIGPSDPLLQKLLSVGFQVFINGVKYEP